MARLSRTVILAKAVLLLAASAQAQPMTEGVIIRVTDGRTPPYYHILNPALGLVWAWEMKDPGARFLRLHFTGIEDASTADYTVLVFDRAYSKVFEWRKAAFGAKRDFWTRLVPHDVARVEVRATVPPDGLRFTVAEYGAYRHLPQIESIYGDPDWTYIQTKPGDQDLKRAARAVAKLSFIREGKLDACSGFLVAEDQLVTNEHCVASPDVCETTVAIFGYERQPDGTEGWEEQAKCVEVLKPSATHDFAMLRLAGTPGQRFGTVQWADRLPRANEPLFLVQHPGGGPKMVSQVQCAVKTPRTPGIILDVDFGHTCDTSWGSSGSPVFDRSFRVLGLHHFGFFAFDPRWKAENRAVRAERILRDIRP